MSKDEEETYDEIRGLDPSFFQLNRENYLKNLKFLFAHLNENRVIILQGASLSQNMMQIQIIIILIKKIIFIIYQEFETLICYLF